MMKVKYYTCPVCKQKFKTLSGWGDHMEKIHPKEWPEGYSTSRYFYMVKTGKTAGKCRTCKGPTGWNEASMKYNQFCSNPKCKEAYVKIAKTRMRNVYGKEYILDDPNMQKKMLSHRKISGYYTFQDGGKIAYVGSYERNFLMMLDMLLEWASSDIIGPSPHVYYYDYENKEYDEEHEGRKFYIPDYYIPSLNLEIEIKQQTSTNQEFNKINRVKEKLKDEIMAKNKHVHYLKINDNDFREFFTYLENAKKDDPEEIEKATESYVFVENDKTHIVMESEQKDILSTHQELSIPSPSCECLNGCDELLFEKGTCEGCEFVIATETTKIPQEIKLIENYLKRNRIKNGIEKTGKNGLDAYMSGESNSLFLICNPNYQKIALDLRKIIDKDFSIREDNYNTLFLHRKKSAAMEEANYSRKNRFPVFIVLQHSGTAMANVIQKFTGDEFSHACIAFNSSLAPLYSFGTKELGTKIPRVGFSIQEEGPDHLFYKLKKAYYSVYVMYVSKDSLAAMQLRLQDFIDNRNMLKYDFRNLISVWRGIPSENSKKWFCSRFVAEIIGAGRKLDKFASLHRPQDFTEFSDITLVNKGSDFKRYNKRVTELNMKRVRMGKFDEIFPANESVHFDPLSHFLVYPSEYEIESLRYAEGKNGMYNGIVRVKGIKDQLRYRTDMLIIQDGKVYLNKKENSSYGLKYTLPGGGIDPGEDPRDTAIRESQEEVRINVANVKYGGSYVKIFGEMKHSWEKHQVKKEDQTTGSFTVVFVGTYFSRYDGKIAKEDRSDIIKTGKFYPIEEVYDILEPIHQQAIDAYLQGGLKNVTPSTMECFSDIDDLRMKDSILPAFEGFMIPEFFKRAKSENSHDSWSRKIFDESSRDLLGRRRKYNNFRLIVKDGKFELHGLSIMTLSNRIKKFYKDRTIYELFIPEYNKADLARFNKKKMSRSQMRIEYLKVDQFFAIELVCLFNDLGERFRDKNYLNIAETIYKESWLSAADKKAEETPLLSTKNLKNLDLKLNDYQQDFIEKYPKLKAQLHLKGYILAFEQGLGKTLTAISLAECLDVDHVYIVCPNSLKANWALEIRKYYKKYKDDEDLWRQEVFICGDKPLLFSEDTTKFIITNNESIEKMFPYVMSGKNMLILDESHNFRNIQSKRVHQLLELRDRLHCVDSLIMSGTPIKATPDEIVPALMMIDPTFTLEAAKTFAKAFKLHSSLGTSLVQTRFNKIMFRKEKNVLGDKLPQKFVHYLPLSIKDGEKYLMVNVNEVVSIRFSEIYDEGYVETRKLGKEFYEMSERYRPAGYDYAQFKRVMRMIVDKDEEVHELDRDYVENYMAKAKALISNKAERDRYDYLIKKYARYRQHCLGLAFGEILPPYRRDMFISLYEDNRRYFINAIESNVKKTLIFTQFKGVALFIHDDLNKNGVRAGLITGDVKNRLDVLKDFKENDQTKVLVATSQTIGTGVTLTEANQMFFFGPPWRESDFEQCCDRIHRIGQTDECNIYTVVLDTGEELNLSTRMDKILAWSKEMTESVIKSTDDMEDLDETNFKELLTANESALMDEFLYKPEKDRLNLHRKLNLSFGDLVTEKRMYPYTEYRAKRLIPENTIILESTTCVEAREIIENAKHPSTNVPNVSFENFCDNKHFHVGLVTTRPIKPGEMIRLPKIE